MSTRSSASFFFMNVPSNDGKKIEAREISVNLSFQPAFASPSSVGFSQSIQLTIVILTQIEIIKVGLLFEHCSQLSLARHKTKKKRSEFLFFLTSHEDIFQLIWKAKEWEWREKKIVCVQFASGSSSNELSALPFTMLKLSWLDFHSFSSLFSSWCCSSLSGETFVASFSLVLFFCLRPHWSNTNSSNNTSNLKIQWKKSFSYILFSSFFSSLLNILLADTVVHSESSWKTHWPKSPFTTWLAFAKEM